MYACGLDGPKPRYLLTTPLPLPSLPLSPLISSLFNYLLLIVFLLSRRLNRLQTISSSERCICSWKRFRRCGKLKKLLRNARSMTSPPLSPLPLSPLSPLPPLTPLPSSLFPPYLFLQLRVDDQKEGAARQCHEG